MHILTTTKSILSSGSLHSECVYKDTIQDNTVQCFAISFADYFYVKCIFAIFLYNDGPRKTLLPKAESHRIFFPISKYFWRYQMNEAGYDMVISRHDEWILDFCELLRGGQSPILCRMKYDSFCSEIQISDGTTKEFLNFDLDMH